MVFITALMRLCVIFFLLSLSPYIPNKRGVLLFSWDAETGGDRAGGLGLPPLHKWSHMAATRKSKLKIPHVCLLTN